MYQPGTLSNFLARFPAFKSRDPADEGLSSRCPQCSCTLDRPHALKCSRCQADIPQARGCSGCGKCRKK